MVSSNEGVVAPGPVAFLPSLNLKEKLSLSLFVSILPLLLLSDWSPGVNKLLLGVSLLGWIWVAIILPKVRLTMLAMDRATWINSRILQGVVFRQCEEEEWFGVDGAVEAVQQRRRAGFAKLKQRLVGKLSKKAVDKNEQIKKGMSDVRLNDSIRTPPPYQKYLNAQLPASSPCVKSEGPYIIDIDGNKSLDISGGWGVNVAGHDNLSRFQLEGAAKTGGLSCGVLGGCVHKVLGQVCTDLKKLSGLDEVSFHMSGTEAVMAASKMARFNTGRRLIVKLGAGYHGWCESLITPAQNNSWHKNLITLKYTDPNTLKFIQSRSNEIACVLFDPFVAIFSVNPDTGCLAAPKACEDKSLSLGAQVKKHCEIMRQKEIDMSKKLRDVCTANKVPFVFDEIWSCFKWSIPGCAQAATGVQGDMVTYGKPLGGGLPCGVVCGRSWLMKRYKKDTPLGSTLVAGTFTASPLLLGTMSCFLEWIQLESSKKLYNDKAKLQSDSFEALNNELEKSGIPVEVHSYDLLFSVALQKPTNYSWLFTYYVTAEGLSMNVFGTANCMCTMEFTAEHYKVLTEAIKRAAKLFFVEDNWHIEGFSKAQCIEVAQGEISNNIMKHYGLGCLLNQPGDSEANGDDLKQPLLA